LRVYLIDSIVSLTLALVVSLAVYSLRLEYRELVERIGRSECRIEAERLAIELLEEGIEPLVERGCEIRGSRIVCSANSEFESSCTIPVYLPRGSSASRVELVVECGG